MKEAFEKIKERLEDAKEQALKLWDGNSRYKGFCQAIDIVKEVVEEYSNSEEEDPTDYANTELYAFWKKHQWIPCSERLPEENGYYLITIKFYHLHNEVTIGCSFEDGEWFKVYKDDKVLAWMPLPEPYQPKEPNNE